MRSTTVMGIALLAGLALGAVGCGECKTDEKEVATPPEGAALLDDTRWLGEPVVAANLTVWPVYSSRQLDIGEFRTLEEAQAEGEAIVREMGGGATNAQGCQQRVNIEVVPGSMTNGAIGRNDEAQPEIEEILNDAETEEQVEAPAAPPQAAAPRPPAQPQAGQARGPQAGQPSAPNDGPQPGDPAQEVAQTAQIILGGGPTVNTLVIENRGDLPILVVAGTIVKGGQQDRQIGQDFVIAAKSTVPVEAFCVEQGRWHSHASGALAFQFSSNQSLGVALKGVRNKAQYEKNQGQVWEEVAKNIDKCGLAQSQTTSLVAAVETEDAELNKQRLALEDQVRKTFAGLATSENPPIGFAYAVNGKVETVRTFAHPRLLDDHLPAFTRAMALESVLAKDEETQDVEALDVITFVARINAAEEKRMQTRAMNVNGVRMAEEGYNGNCYVNPTGEVGPDEVIILTSDWTSK